MNGMNWLDEVVAAVPVAPYYRDDSVVIFNRGQQDAAGGSSAFLVAIPTPTW